MRGLPGTAGPATRPHPGCAPGTATIGSGDWLAGGRGLVATSPPTGPDSGAATARSNGSQTTEVTAPPLVSTSNKGPLGESPTATAKPSSTSTCARAKRALRNVSSPAE